MDGTNRGDGSVPHEDGSLLRGVLAVGILGGLLIPTFFFLFAEVTPLAWDFLAYLEGADAYLAGEQFIGVTPDVGGGEFVYPPIVVLAFVPYALAGGWLGPFVVQSAVNLAFGAGVALLTIRIIEDRLGRPLATSDRALVVAFCLVSTYPMIALGQGQVDPGVALLLCLGFLWIERGEQLHGGIAFAVAAVFKLFPALIGIWLLHRRAWRAVLTAIATGLGAIAASLLIFGVDTHLRYLEFIFTERSRVEEFGGTIDPNFMALTLNRPLSALLPGVDPSLYTPIAAVIFAPILWTLYTRAETFEDRLVAFLGTLIAILLVSPASNLNHVVYLVFPLIALGFLVRHRRSRRLIFAGMLLMAVPVQPAQIRRSLELLGVAGEGTGPVLGTVETVLTTASVTLYGLTFVVAGCLVFALRSRTETVDVEPVGERAD